MDTNNPKVAPTNEIVAAISANGLSKKERTSFSADPKDYLKTRLDIIFHEDFTLNIVENTGKEVHVSLPYYESYESTLAEQLSDSDVEDIVGGEIIISLIIGAATGFGIGAAISAVAGTGFTLVAGAVAPIIGVGAIVGAAAGATAGATAVGVGLGVGLTPEEERPKFKK